MLVLKRKLGQSLTIADGITVTVLGTGSNGVCLGIDAPRGVPVHRSEILRNAQPDGTLTDGTFKATLNNAVQKGNSKP